MSRAADDRRHGEHHPRRPLVPVAVDPLMAFERFVEERTRSIVFARELGQLSQRLERFERRGVIRPPEPALFGERLLERRTRRGVLAS